MSLVENLINQISTNGLSGITKPQDFDWNDDTFAKILDKQMNSLSITDTQTPFSEMGAPAGLVIEPFDGIDFSNTAQDQMESLGVKTIEETNISEPFEIKDVNMGDYFSNLLKASTDNKDFMNFAKKHASNAYDLFRKSYVTDVIDFAEGISASLQS